MGTNGSALVAGPAGGPTAPGRPGAEGGKPDRLGALGVTSSPAFQALRPFFQKFLEAYFTGLKPTAAMRAAHPALKRPDVAASKALNRDDVQAAIVELREDVASMAGIRPAHILRELAVIAFGDIRELYDEDGALRPVHELSREAAAQIAGLEIEEITDGWQVVGRVRKVKRTDRVRALEALARHPALFPAAAEVERGKKSATVFNIQINIGSPR